MNKNSRILMNYHTIYAHAHGENNKKSYESAFLCSTKKDMQHRKQIIYTSEPNTNANANPVHIKPKFSKSSVFFTFFSKEYSATFYLSHFFDI